MFGFAKKSNGQTGKKTLPRGRKLLVLAAMVGVGGVCMAASPAQAHEHDRGRINIGFGVDVGRVWVPPVYETRNVQVWVEPTYRTVCDRVWVEETCADPVSVWVPDRYEVRTVAVGHGRIIQRQVLAEPGHYVKQAQAPIPGHWQDVTRQVIDVPGHYEICRQQVEVAPGRYDDCAAPAIRFGFYGRR